MTELINILLQITLVIIIFSVGYPVYNNDKNYFEKKSNICNQFIFNLVLHLNIILFLSFAGFSLYLITKIFIFYLLASFIIMVYKNRVWFKEEKFYLIFLLIILFIFSIDLSISLTQDWDSQIVWFYKTLAFYNDGNIRDLVKLPQGDGYTYPYIGSLIWALFWNLSLINEEYSGRIIYLFLYIIALFSLSENLKTNFTNKIIFLLILILLSYEYILFSGSQDILIFCFISYSAFYIHKIFAEKKNKLKISVLILLPLIFNCLIWTKHEGMVYSFIILFILIFFSHLKLNIKIYLIFTTLFLISFKILIYKIFGLDTDFNSVVFEEISLLSIFENIFSYKLLIFFKYFFYFGFLKNFFFILGLISFIIYLQIKKFDQKVLYIFLFYMMTFGFLLAAHTSMSESLDLEYMLKVNMKRLIFAISPFFILLITETINIVKKTKF